jgi:hypothetical protein
MKNGGLRKLFALVTALTMLFVTLAGTALEEELPAKVTLNSGDTLELEGSLLTVNENGAQLISDGSGDISLLINGEILSLSEAASVGYIYIQALTIDASAGDTVTAEIGEGITATVESDDKRDWSVIQKSVIVVCEITYLMLGCFYGKEFVVG